MSFWKGIQQWKLEPVRAIQSPDVHGQFRWCSHRRCPTVHPVCCNEIGTAWVAYKFMSHSSGGQRGGVRALFGLRISHCFITGWERTREFCGVPFIKALITFIRAPPHDLSTFRKPHPEPSHWALGFPHLNSGGTLTLGIRISTFEFWGNPHIGH